MSLQINRKIKLVEENKFITYIQENQSLKTIIAFLNCDGGTLLIVVEDSGEIIGIESDMFENQDNFLLHFANLVIERTGSQHIDLICSEISNVNGKNVFRVECKPSPSPVFLRGKDGEKFYLRNGSSSVSL